MRLPAFAESIKKCDAIVKPLGIDIYDILTNKSEDAFDDISNSFLGIISIQASKFIINAIHFFNTHFRAEFTKRLLINKMYF